MNFIIDGNLPFNVVQLPSFKTLLESICGRKILMPTRYKLMLTLETEYKKAKAKLKELMAKQENLCLTTDVWSSRAQSYLGVTVHFINSSFRRESYVLAFKELKFRQTYKELAKNLDEVFKDFDLDTSKITNIVTDGGSAFCKMFKVYGDEAGSESEQHEELDSDIEDVDIDEENLSRFNESQTFMEDVNRDLFASEILNFDTTSMMTSSAEPNQTEIDSYFGNERDTVHESEQQIKMPKQRRCVSHEINLLSKDFLNELSGMARTSLVSAMSKLHSLWVLTHRSSRAKTICKDILGVCLMVPCETRWNSRFDAVKKCLCPEVQPNINKLIETLKKELDSASNLQPLGTQDFTVLSSYLKVMDPVAKSLDKMQAELNSSQGLIIPVLRSMKYHIENLNDSTNILKDFKACMLNVIDNRFSHYFLLNESNRELILASTTLPSVKKLFIRSDEELIYVKNVLIAELKKMHAESAVNDDVINDEAEDTPEDDFLVSFPAMRNIRLNSIESDIESEAARFLVDVRVDVSILDEYPRVKKAYLKFNTTLSSSAAVERVFSQSMMIFTPRRNRLSAKKFEEALFLKHNRKIIDTEVQA